MLLTLELDPARQELVTGIFEKYHTLSETEEQELKVYLKGSFRKHCGFFILK
ncbi:hypothetical protein [Anaerobacillus alkaliphilus]